MAPAATQQLRGAAEWRARKLVVNLETFAISEKLRDVMEACRGAAATQNRRQGGGGHATTNTPYQSEIISDAVDAASIKHEFVELDGNDHSFSSSVS